MVVVVSDDYLQSKECDFQTKFALSLSPGKLRPAWVQERGRRYHLKMLGQECKTKTPQISEDGPVYFFM